MSQSNYAMPNFIYWFPANTSYIHRFPSLMGSLPLPLPGITILRALVIYCTVFIFHRSPSVMGQLTIVFCVVGMMVFLIHLTASVSLTTSSALVTFLCSSHPKSHCVEQGGIFPRNLGTGFP